MIKNEKLKIEKILKSELIDTYISFLKYDDSFIGWLISLDDIRFEEVLRYCYKGDQTGDVLYASLVFVVMFGYYPEIHTEFQSFEWNYYYSKINFNISEVLNYRIGKFVLVDHKDGKFDFRPNLGTENQYETTVRYFDEKNFDVHNKLRKNE